MEEVISLYTEEGEPDPARPYVCFDETRKQLGAETRQPLPPKPGKPARFDYEYERRGTANGFLLVAPRLGWRQVNVTARRTRVDFALQRRLLVDDYFPPATTIRVVLDNLNTHNPASLYEAFAPAEAKRILEQLEFIHTPKHASWLNMAEIELSLLSRQCLKPRVPDNGDAPHGDQRLAKPSATPTRLASTGPSAWKMLAESSPVSTQHLQHDEALVAAAHFAKREYLWARRGQLEPTYPLDQRAHIFECGSSNATASLGTLSLRH